MANFAQHSRTASIVSGFSKVSPCEAQIKWQFIFIFISIPNHIRIYSFIYIDFKSFSHFIRAIIQCYRAARYTWIELAKLPFGYLAVFCMKEYNVYLNKGLSIN